MKEAEKGGIQSFSQSTGSGGISIKAMTPPEIE